MFNRDGRHFYIRKVYPKEAISLKGTIEETFREYIATYFKEKPYIEVQELSPFKREMRFDVTFQKAPFNPSEINALLEKIITVIMSDKKIQGETLFRDSYVRMIDEMVRKLN